MKHNTLFVIRGHKTTDIVGVDEVSCVDTAQAITHAAARYGPATVLAEVNQIRLQDAISHCRSKTYQNMVYIGGTALMMYKLRNIVRFSINKGVTTYCVKKFKRATISVGTGYVDFMIYKKRTKTGKNITVFFGASPTGTTIATMLDDQYEVLEGCSERLVIGKVGRSDLSDLVVLYDNQSTGVPA